MLHEKERTVNYRVRTIKYAGSAKKDIAEDYDDNFLPRKKKKNAGETKLPSDQTSKPYKEGKAKEKTKKSTGKDRTLKPSFVKKSTRAVRNTARSVKNDIKGSADVATDSYDTAPLSELKKIKSGIKKTGGLGKTIARAVKAVVAVVVSIVKVMTSNLALLLITIAVILISSVILFIQTTVHDFIADKKDEISNYCVQLRNSFYDAVDDVVQSEGYKYTSRKTEGDFASWKETISVWYVLSQRTSDKDDYEALQDVFNSFNKYTYTVVQEGEDTVLTVYIENLSIEEVMDMYGFSEGEKQDVEELLADEELWDALVFAESATVNGLVWPTDGYYYVTSNFGPRNLYGTFHHGIDIGCPEGTPVHAASSGTVTYAGWNNSLGNYVTINHGSMKTLYGHNSKLLVASGDTVAAGQVIAYSGNTGQSTGPHCHLAIMINGVPGVDGYVNPAPYMGLPADFTGDASSYIQ